MPPEPCPEGKERHPKTGRCRKIRPRKPCKEGQIRSAETGRCRNVQTSTRKRKPKSSAAAATASPNASCKDGACTTTTTTTKRPNKSAKRRKSDWLVDDLDSDYDDEDEELESDNFDVDNPEALQAKQDWEDFLKEEEKVVEEHKQRLKKLQEGVAKGMFDGAKGHHNHMAALANLDCKDCMAKCLKSMKTEVLEEELKRRNSFEGQKVNVITAKPKMGADGKKRIALFRSRRRR